MYYICIIDLDKNKGFAKTRFYPYTVLTIPHLENSKTCPLHLKLCGTPTNISWIQYS